MLAALVEGTRDPAALADLAKGKLRSKLPALRTALEGRFGPRHAVLVSEILSHLDYLDEAIGRMTSAIEEAIAPFAEARDRLCSIPGIDRRIAEAVIGEIGVDMGRFPTAAHLASWAGMCPGQHESAGKQKRGTARHGDSWLQRHLAVAAMAAVCSKDTYLRAQYRRLSPRRGKQRARKAVGHSILVACWHVLASDDATYLDLGPDWFDRRNAPAVRARRKLSELRALGCQLYINDDGTTTVVLPAA
jgi:transposase